MATNFQTLSFRVITVILLHFLYLRSFGQDTSLLKANKQTVVRYFDEMINTQKLSDKEKFFSPDFIWHQMDGKDARSPEDTSHIAMKRFLFAAIPDVHYTMDHIIAEGDMVAINTTVTGTAKGEMFGLAPVQKKVRFKQMFFYRLKNNKITEQWEVVDVEGLKAQLAQQK